MTAEGASSQSGPARARGWRAVRRLSSRTSLRTKLITALITLVILALAAISFAGISILRGYLIGQTDNTLRSETIEQLGVHAVNDSLNGNGCGGTGVGLANSKYAVWWIPPAAPSSRLCSRWPEGSAHHALAMAAARPCRLSRPSNRGSSRIPA